MKWSLYFLSLSNRGRQTEEAAGGDGEEVPHPEMPPGTDEQGTGTAPEGVCVQHSALCT